MNNYKITIQYDGTRYKGWQGQNSTGLTIQGKIEAVLGQMAGHAVEVIGSGERMRVCMPKARWQIFISKNILRMERFYPI